MREMPEIIQCEMPISQLHLEALRNEIPSSKMHGVELEALSDAAVHECRRCQTAQQR